MEKLHFFSYFARYCICYNIPLSFSLSKIRHHNFFLPSVAIPCTVILQRSPLVLSVDHDICCTSVAYFMSGQFLLEDMSPNCKGQSDDLSK